MPEIPNPLIHLEMLAWQGGNSAVLRISFCEDFPTKENPHLGVLTGGAIVGAVARLRGCEVGAVARLGNGGRMRRICELANLITFYSVLFHRMRSRVLSLSPVAEAILSPSGVRVSCRRRLTTGAIDATAQLRRNERLANRLEDGRRHAGNHRRDNGCRKSCC